MCVVRWSCFSCFLVMRGIGRPLCSGLTEKGPGLRTAQVSQPQDSRTSCIWWGFTIISIDSHHYWFITSCRAPNSHRLGKKINPVKSQILLGLPFVPLSGLFGDGQGCCNKVPQTRWLNTTEMYSLRVRESRVPAALGEEPSLPLSSFWRLWALLAVLWLADTLLQCLSPPSRGILAVVLCVHISLFL